MGNLPSSDSPWYRFLHLAHDIAALKEVDLQDCFEDQSLEGCCARFELLHYLVHSILGWENIGHGLRRSYLAEHPELDSEVLKTIQSYWRGIGELDYYAAWQWKKVSSFDLKDASATKLAANSWMEDLDWWRKFLTYRVPVNNPFYGGTNALHLGHSDYFGFETPGPYEGYYEKSSRKAILLISRLASWRSELTCFDKELPHLTNRSWRVQVFDRDCGWRGTFRKSRVTNKWFCGSHSVHMLGNWLLK